MKPSPETYKARPHMARPTRLTEIRNAVFAVLEKEMYRHGVFSSAEAKALCVCLSGNIVNELTDTHLIGLPNEDGARTSVNCEIIAKLGAKCNCEKNEDADDVIRAALQVIG